jgi:tetratricopeptide (TPR) repeat protein
MELTLDEALQKAIEAHKAGQIQEADRLYTAILQAQPKHPDANHNMGVLAVSVGKVKEALPFFKTALEANPSIGQYWLSYIDALINLDRMIDAKTVLAEAKSKGANGEAFDQLEQRLNAPNETPVETDLHNNDQDQTRVSALDTLNLDQAIKLAKKKLKERSSEDAKRIYNDILARFPKNKKALDGIKSLSGGFIGQVKEPPQGQLQQLINLYQQGQLQQTLDSAIQLLSQFPNSLTLYNIQGAANSGLGQLDSAIDSYKQALKIKPDSTEAYNNMGMALNDKGDPEAAIVSYKQAIKIKPDFAEAYNNMGIALNDKGDLEAAIVSYEQALKIKPDYAEAAANSVLLLTSYIPQKRSPNPIIKVHEAIQKIDITCKSSNIISDEHIVNLFLESSRFIRGNSLDIKTELSQTYRRNSVDLNCKRHMSIFNQHDIIPEFCFGCYKVQVEPRTIIELIKLYVAFDQLELNENNTRKCMVELRPAIPGFYKGLIYCSGLKQANQIAEYLDRVVKDNIAPGLSVKVKRGCSEYPISFPDYKEINNSGPQLMNYTKDWKVIEDDYDRKKPMKAKENIIPSLSGLNLNDVLIIRKWVDYAKGIGDPTVDLIDENTVYYQEIHDQAKARLKTFQFIR